MKLCNPFCVGVLALVLMLCTLVNERVAAQEVHDIGVQGGISTYLGDFNNANLLYSPSPVGGIHYRYNISSYDAVRISINVGKLSGSSENVKSYMPGLHARIDFSELFYSLDVKYELNFLPFDPLKSNTKIFSPYLFGGVGLYVYSGSLVPAIPFGVGVKVAATDRLVLGLEAQQSKTFYDKLDGYSNLTDSPSFIHNNDWFFSCGLVISYRLKYGQKICPVYL